MKHKIAEAFPLEWIFAIIAGVTIIFLSIYGVSKMIPTFDSSRNIQVAETIKSFIDPMETGLASGKSDIIHFTQNSSIYFEECNSNEGNFGTQTIAFSDKTLNKENEKGENMPIVNKYVFSDSKISGKDFFIFSKPFFLSFKVSDLIIIGSSKYCFVNAPSDIQRAFEEMDKINFFNFTTSINECGEFDKKVCFGISDSSCSIKVTGSCTSDCSSEYDYGRIQIRDETGRISAEEYYTGNLIYAGIFSSPELYSCNIERLMKRYHQLALVYLDKIKIIELKGCSSTLGPKLNNILSLSKKLKSSFDLAEITFLSKEINDINKAAQSGCKLYTTE